MSPLASRGPQSGAQGRIGDDALEGVAQRRNVAGRHVDPGGAVHDQFGQSADRRRHHRPSRRHRLQGDSAEGLRPDRRHHGREAMAPGAQHVLVGDLLGDDDAGGK